MPSSVDFDRNRLLSPSASLSFGSPFLIVGLFPRLLALLVLLFFLSCFADFVTAGCERRFGLFCQGNEINPVHVAINIGEIRSGQRSV